MTDDRTTQSTADTNIIKLEPDVVDLSKTIKLEPDVVDLSKITIRYSGRRDAWGSEDTYKDIPVGNIPDFKWPTVLGAETKRTYGIEFGAPRRPKGSKTPNRKHAGIDLAFGNQHNGVTDVIAAYDGEIRHAEEWKNGTAGNTVYLLHDGPNKTKWGTVYMHMAFIDSKVKHKIGKWVAKGQVLGKVGRTNFSSSTEAHLHFGITHHVNSPSKSVNTFNSATFVDPEAILNRQSSTWAAGSPYKDQRTSSYKAEYVQPGTKSYSTPSGTSNTGRALISSLPVEPNLLTQFAFMPQAQFIQPPKCNTIFPCMNTALDMSRNFMREPTRAICYTNYVGNVPQVFLQPSEIVTQGMRKPVVASQVTKTEGTGSIGPPLTSGLNVQLNFGEITSGDPSDEYIFTTTVGQEIVAVADGIVTAIQSLSNNSTKCYTEADAQAAAKALADGKPDDAPRTTDGEIIAEGKTSHTVQGKLHWIYSKGNLSGKEAKGNYIHIKLNADGGYIVEHNNLLAINTDLAPGSNVNQGMVVGYAGATGRVRTAKIGAHIKVIKEKRAVNTAEWFGITPYTNNPPPEPIPVIDTVKVGAPADPEAVVTTSELVSPISDIQPTDNVKETQKASNKAAKSAEQDDGIKQGEPDHHYLTPEERRKGIIVGVMEFYNRALAVNATRATSKQLGLTKEQFEEFRLNFPDVANPDMSATTKEIVGPHIGFVAKTLYAWWLKSRFDKRSISSSPGGFNPYMLAGFPSLILDPIRSIIAQVSTVTHSIQKKGSATTTVSMHSPRYWDEGDPLFWMRGDRDPKGRNFYSWMNQNFIAANDNSALNNVYEYFIGCKAIEYESVNKGQSIPTRNPFTSAIIDYNNKIDGRDSKNRRLKGTIASGYFGIRDDPEAQEVSAEKKEIYAQNYIKRDIVTEKELLVDFMKCKQAGSTSAPNYTGGCFTNYEQYSSSETIGTTVYTDTQVHIRNYVSDIKANPVRYEG